MYNMHKQRKMATEDASVLNRFPPEDVSYSKVDTEHGRAISVPHRIGILMNITNHMLILCFTLYVCYLSFQPYSLFSWHPLCMTLGALTLMAEAIVAMSHNDMLFVRTNRQTRIRAHWVLQALAATFIFIGFLIIVINKIIHNKSHFQSLHAIVGLIAIVCICVASTGGVATLFVNRLKHIVKPAVMKLAHNCLGVVTFALGTVSVILGLYTGWFQENAGYTSQTVCTVVIILLSLLTLQYAVRSALVRLRALYPS